MPSETGDRRDHNHYLATLDQIDLVRSQAVSFSVVEQKQSKVLQRNARRHKMRELSWLIYAMRPGVSVSHRSLRRTA